MIFFTAPAIAPGVPPSNNVSPQAPLVKPPNSHPFIKSASASRTDSKDAVQEFAKFVEKMEKIESDLEWYLVQFRKITSAIKDRHKIIKEHDLKVQAAFLKKESLLDKVDVLVKKPVSSEINHDTAFDSCQLFLGLDQQSKIIPKDPIEDKGDKIYFEWLMEVIAETRLRIERSRTDHRQQLTEETVLADCKAYVQANKEEKESAEKAKDAKSYTMEEEDDVLLETLKHMLTSAEKFLNENVAAERKMSGKEA